MLTRVDDGPAVVACNTCRHMQQARGTAQERCDGALLVRALQDAKAASLRYSGIAVQEMPCLFACTEGCTVYLRAPGKVGYVLGRFAPDADAAHAILHYAVHYADSEHGQVPFELWPQGVKGHFITRMPPAGYVTD